MAENIKGITIEIGGDVTGLNSALKDVNKQSSSLQSELSKVERLLKLDPTNTELLSQKQNILADAVENTSSKLNALKEAEKQVQEQVKNGSASEEQYRALQREIVSTEQRLKSLEDETKKFGSVTAQELKAAGDKVGEYGDKIKNAGERASIASAAIVAGGAVAVSAASDIVESTNKVDVAFGKSGGEVEKFADKTLASFGIAKGTALDMASLFGDMGTSMGLTQNQAADMSMSLTGLAGDLSSFKNIGIDQSMEALKGIFTGETESLKSLGVIMTQTNLDAFALANGFGKTTSEMTAAEQVQLRYAFVMDATKNAQGDFARTADGTANSIRVMQESTKELSAEFGEVLLPLITPIIQGITDMLKWLGGLDESTKSIIVTIALVIASIGPLLVLIGQIASGIGAILSIAPMLGAAFTALTGPVGLIITAIAALVAGLLYLWKTNETFRTTVITIWEAIKTYFLAFVETVKTLFGEFTTFIQENFGFMWDSLTKAFDAFKALFEGDFKGFFTNIIAAAATWISGFKNIGENIVKGIWEGIKGLASWFYSQVEGFFGNLVTKAKKAVGIHSPSTVFAEMGKNMVLGLDKGWNNELATAQRSIYNGMESLANVNTSNINNSRSIVQNVNIIASKAIDEMETIKQIRQQGVLMQMQIEG